LALLIGAIPFVAGIRKLIRQSGRQATWFGLTAADAFSRAVLGKDRRGGFLSAMTFVRIVTRSSHV
jgi:hypothetical protein